MKLKKLVNSTLPFCTAENPQYFKIICVHINYTHTGSILQAVGGTKGSFGRAPGSVPGVGAFLSSAPCRAPAVGASQGHKLEFCWDI